MVTRSTDVDRSTGSDQAGLRRRHQGRDQEFPVRKTKGNSETTLYGGEIYDGEYGDGNIAGILVTAGKRKSGKTFLQWREFNLATHRRIIFDTEDQYKPAKGYDISGWKVFHQPGELRAYLATQLHADSMKVLYKPLVGKKLWHFRTVSRNVIEYARRSKGLLYGVDEIDQFCSPKEDLDPELNEIVEYGRHRLMSVSCTTRRPHKVSRNLTAQSAEIRIFKTTEPLDLKYFREYVGSAVKELPRLGQYQYLRWVDTGEVDIRGGKI